VGLVKAPDASASGRGLRLGKLGLTLTGSYLGYQFQNLFLGEEAKTRKRREFNHQTSRHISRELGELKGPVMKLGQILSMQSQLLPAEAIQELASLQMQAPGMHPTLARAQFKASLGKDPEAVFRHFSPEPFAAASLGQVHLATTKRGEKVAVKIQYPGIAKAIDNDFKLLRSVTLPGRIAGYAPKDLLDEIQRGFAEETDYLKEAANIRYFRQALERLDFVKVPSVLEDLTTERVLTMSFIEGRSVGEFLASKPSKAVLDRIGSRLVELYHYQIQCLGVLHADHQPGNYLFRSDGSIGLVDYGCVKRLAIDFADLSACCVNRTWREGAGAAAHVCRLIFGPNVSIRRAQKMFGDLEALVELLFPEPPAGRFPVDFGKAELLNRMVKCYGAALKHKLTNPEFAFVTRAELGLVSLLHQLSSVVNTREIWRRVHDLAIKDHCAVSR